MLVVDYLLGTSRSFLLNLVTSFNSAFVQNVSVRGNRIVFPHTVGAGHIELHELEDGMTLMLMDASFVKDIQFVCDTEDSGFYALYFFVGQEKIQLRKNNDEELLVGNAWENGILFSSASSSSVLTVPPNKRFKCAVVLMHKRWLMQLQKEHTWLKDIADAKGERANQFMQSLNIQMLLTVNDMFSKSSWLYVADTYLAGSVKKLLSQFYDTVVNVQKNDKPQRELLPFDEVLVAMNIKKMLEKDIKLAQLRIEQMTGRSRMSKLKLNVLFKILYGDHLTAIVHKVRMQTAVEMLLQGYSILEVGRKAGYGNTSHFARTFFNTFKITPKRYQIAARPLKEGAQKHVAPADINYY